MRLYLFFLIPLILFGISTYWLRKWNGLWPFLIINVVLIVPYEIYFVKSELPSFLRNNSYGFERLLLFVIAPIVHALLVFFFALIMKNYLRK